MILETRQNNEVVNTVANNITSCQIPSNQSHSTQPFEESVAKLDQANGRVWNKTFYNLNINIFLMSTSLHYGIGLLNPKYFSGVRWRQKF